MGSRFAGLMMVFATMILFSLVAIAQSDSQSQPKKARIEVPAGPAPVRDLNGVWLMRPGPGEEGPGGDMPPMTAWAQAKYDANKPGYGPKAQPGGNDPILQCDPSGFPRIIFLSTRPFEIATIPGRMLQFFEREHAWREIWTDGRSLPADPDPTWYGYSVGRWVDDYTFVVDSNGFDDRTWLGAQGQPHSDEMKLEERYHRIDSNTIEFNLKIEDPKAYTKTWEIAPRFMKLVPKGEIPQSFCVWSEEEEFARRVRMPAAAPPKK